MNSKNDLEGYLRKTLKIGDSESDEFERKAFEPVLPCFGLARLPRRPEKRSRTTICQLPRFRTN